MKVSELGEFGLIARLAGTLASQATTEAAGRLAVGIDDDAAVWRTGTGALVATTDALLAGVHFLPDRTPWRDLGWKALAVNVSDIAAMGGSPLFALVTIGLPAELDVERVDALYEGLLEAAQAYGVTIVGGDVVRAEAPFVSVTLVGEAELDTSGEPLVLRRSAAQAGDLIAVTGALGGAAGGLHALREGRSESDTARPLIERHLRPQARLAEGRAALAAGVRCAIDVSDGLLQDLHHLCRSSRLGAVVWRDQVPVEPGLADLVGPDEALRYAVAGGEDYELLVVAGREQLDALQGAIETPLTVIGEMVIDPRQEAKLLDESGQALAVGATGWDHLKPSS